MRLLSRWWFASLLVGAILLVWAVTVAPWAPWHERTVAEVRLSVRAPADHPQTAVSSSFSIRGDTLIVTVTADRPSGTPLPRGFMGSATWVVRRAVRGTSSGDPTGSAEFTGASPAPVRATIGGDSDEGLPVMDFPPSRLRLTVTGVASAPATIAVRVTQPRDTVAGVPIPLVLVIACVVLVGIPATSTKTRWGKPVVFPPTHEHY